jgi:shikimate dehydrogenase
MSRCIGLIGYPLKHSISPCFQQAALDYYKLDIRYEAWETDPAELREIVNKLRQPENVGANVTVPYKQKVLPLLDEIDDLASLIGAVNTVVSDGDKLLGFNTDAHGFVEGLVREGHFSPKGKKAVVLGAGGVARAVGFALVQENVASLAITDGVADRSTTLAGDLVSYVKRAMLNPNDWEPNISAFEWQELESARTLEGCDLIVHCTTIGMKDDPQEGQSPLKAEVIPRNVLVYDVVYNPWTTPLLGLARKAGANILGGLSMLVYQGAASFKLWINREAPVDIMFARAREVLTRGKV